MKKKYTFSKEEQDMAGLIPKGETARCSLLTHPISYTKFSTNKSS
jgi:hypothetical protein